jgi:putative DNA primase/helicase
MHDCDKVMSRRQLARLLGGTLNGAWINIRGPGHSNADRSLGFRIGAEDPHGFTIHSLAGDDPTVCRAHVKALLNKIATGPFAFQRETVVDKDRTIRCRLDRAMKIWSESQPAKGTLVERYLQARRCWNAETVVSSETLRFHPACPFGVAARFPAMVGLLRDVITGDPRGIHRTALAADGSAKRVMPEGTSPKWMLGSAKGAAVILQPCGRHLGLAEGLETALSANIVFRLPVWAALSAISIRNFPVITGCESLVVFADNDRAGLSAACRCAERYASAGTGVTIRSPRKTYTDWNDYLRTEVSDAYQTRKKKQATNR